MTHSEINYPPSDASHYSTLFIGVLGNWMDTTACITSDQRFSKQLRLDPWVQGDAGCRRRRCAMDPRVERYLRADEDKSRGASVKNGKSGPVPAGDFTETHGS